MAKNTSQAARAAAAAKPKQAKKAPAKSKAKKSKSTAKTPKIRTEYENTIPATTITAIICFVLFVLFLVICIKPDGKILLAIRDLFAGLIGRAGFYFSVPALLYLFLINTFGRKTRVVMRSVCTIIFVFFCGCIYHLAIHTQSYPSGIALFPSLYLTGIQGTSGGVLCGGLAVLLRWAFGGTVSAILIGIGAVLTLLGALEITIPSLIRAIINRPRDNWEDEEQEEVYIEPAAAVVNRITNKQIEKKRQRRQLEKQRELLAQQNEPPAELLCRHAGRA